MQGWVKELVGGQAERAPLQPSLRAHCWISASVASPRGDPPRKWPQSHLHLLLLSDVPSVARPPLSSVHFNSFRSHPSSSHRKLSPRETWVSFALGFLPLPDRNLGLPPAFARLLELWHLVAAFQVLF